MGRLYAKRGFRHMSSSDEDASNEADDPLLATVEVDDDLLDEADDHVSVGSDSEVVNVALRLLFDKHSALTDYSNR